MDATALGAVIGSKRAALVARLAKRKFAGDVRNVVEAGEDPALEYLLRDMVAGKLQGPAYNYRRAMALVADGLGSRLDGELTLPGRGWQQLAPAWRHWGLDGLAKLWSTEPAWAKKKGLRSDWPRVLVAPPTALAGLIRGIEKFDHNLINARGVPTSIDRFSDPAEWPLDMLSTQIAHIAGEVWLWAKAAKKKNKALVLWLDGQQ